MIRLAKFASAVAVMLLLIAPADLQSAEKSDATTTLDAHIGNLNALAESGKIGAQLALASLYEYRKQDYIQAVKWYRKAAEQKHGYAMFILGKMYESGRGVGLSNVEAANWYRKAAEQGYQDAFYSLAHLYESSGNGEKDIAEAIIWYRRAAEQGDAFAQMYLGQKYRIGQGVPLGWGVPQDSAEALKWYRRAADQGDWVALSNLGSMYERGDGTPRDYVEAIKWYNKAADEGDGCSLINVGSMYYNGTGVQQSYAEAAKWYRKAVRHGCDSAMAPLRRMYQQGLITPEDNAEASWLARNGPVEIPPEAKAAEMRGDYVEAAKWYRQAAEQGHGYAQLTLGEMYYRGEGVRQDFAEAAKWIRRAADQGIDSARTILGGMYYRGQGIPQSHEEAAKWMRRAADRLYPEAMFNLGVMYHEGTGVPQDDIKAIHWTRKAADYGFSSAEQNLGTVEIYGNTSTAITPRDAENVNSSTDKQNSIGELTKRAEDGDAVAQLKLGDIYRKGIGVTQNFSEAVRWYRKAADQGDVGAQYSLGQMYSEGKGVPQDRAEAARWYRKISDKNAPEDHAQAAQVYRNAAEKGDAKSQYKLGGMYFQGLGVTQSYPEAARWFRKAAEQGHVGAQYLLGIMYAAGEGIRQNLSEAARWLRKAADQGDANAQSRLGSMHYEGKGVPQDYLEAAGWFRKAADQGNAEAQSYLGSLYRTGQGVPKDHAEAARWYHEAADQGQVDAQFFLGLLYSIGGGVPQDLDEARRWYRKAADQGAAEAQYQLGVIYRNGFGVPQDWDEARRWYRKAADQGAAEAQYQLGVIYWNGLGVTQDKAEARRWIRKAADQGFAEAQVVLGNYYATGDGIPKNLTEAARLYRMAADQGFAPAQFETALLTRFGQGVPKDIVSAYMWSLLSVSGMKPGDSYYDMAHKLRNDAVQVMTPQQVATAEKLAQAWKPKRQAAEPAAATKAAPALTTAETAPKLVQGEPPQITLHPISATTAQTVEVTGKVTGKGRVTGLQIDGTDIPVRRDGTFSTRRGIPLGESQIKVLATDEWGRSSEARIAVNRTVASTETAYPPLRSNLIHGKPRPDAVVLIIGVEQYKSVPQADFAENDAKTFYDFAINALGVPASRVKLLTGQNAQKVDVDAAILTWLKPLVAAGKTDVFVYFSGHGLASDDGKELFLLPQDGNRALLDRSAIRRSELIDMVISTGAKSAMFFIDACYSGGTRGTESLVASARPVLLTAKEQSVPPNVTILAAAANDQLSSALGQAKHGLFSYFLMRGLSGEAAAGDRTVTAGELAAYLAERVPPEAARLGRSQTPQLVGDGSKVIATW